MTKEVREERIKQYLASDINQNQFMRVSTHNNPHAPDTPGQQKRKIVFALFVALLRKYQYLFGVYYAMVISDIFTTLSFHHLRYLIFPTNACRIFNCYQITCNLKLTFGMIGLQLYNIRLGDIYYRASSSTRVPPH